MKDLSRSKKIKVLKEVKTEPLFAAEVFSSGDRLISVGLNHNLTLWEIKDLSKKEVCQFPEKQVTLRISKDSRYVVIGGADKKLYVWNMKKGELARTITGQISADFNTPSSLRAQYRLAESNAHNLTVTCVDISADGQYIGSGSEDRTIKLWNMNNGNLIRTLDWHNRTITSVQFSSDGSLILSASQDKKLRVWDVVTGAVKKVFKGHNAPVLKGVWVDEKTILSCAEDKKMIRWDYESETIKNEIELPEKATVFYPHPKKGIVFIGFEDGSIGFLDPDQMEVKEGIPVHKKRISILTGDSKGKYLISAGDDHVLKVSDIG